MKSYLLCFLFLMTSLHGCSYKQQGQQVDSPIVSEAGVLEQKSKLRHIVLFKFKESATESDVLRVEQAFAQLPEKIRAIKGFEWGINNSPENSNKGFTHGFMLTFDSEEGRAAYLPHPEHKAFGRILDPILDDVLVIDYWTD